jgi:hypothetical protein
MTVDSCVCGNIGRDCESGDEGWHDWRFVADFIEHGVVDTISEGIEEDI